MNKVYLLLGSNIGESKKQITLAIKHINRQTGKVVRSSSLYVTQPWGNVHQPDFLNQVIVIETNLSAQQTISSILSIEKQMGRVRTTKNAPRIIDIDILFFNKDVIDEKNLNIPHPQIQNRRFVLTPLNELSPNLQHPVLNQSMHQLLQKCPDVLNVKKF